MSFSTGQGEAPDHSRAEGSKGPRASRSWVVWVALITIYVVWGSTYLGIRFAIESLPPFMMAGTRFLVAGTAMYAWRRASGDVAPSRREWRSAAIVGLLLLAGGNGCVAWAEQRIASGVAALLVATLPLWMVFIDALRPGRRHSVKRGPGWRAVLGVLVGFCGVVVLIRPTESAGGVGTVDLIGAAAVILGAFLWSVGSLYSRNAPLPSSPLLGTSMEMIVGGVGLFLLATLTGEWGRLNVGTVSTRSLLALGYLIVFGSWVAFTAYTWLLRAAPTPLVSTYAYVNPLVAILLGHVLAGEPLTLHVLVAGAIIVGSVALVTATGPARSKPGPKRPRFAPAEET
jgi:drug/metabolite transporter (DMT)-like permease